MNPNQSDQFQGHPSELLLAYVEEILEPVRNQSVDRHVQACPECAEEVRMLTEMITLLRTHGEAFCPESWELAQMAADNTNVSGSTEQHLERCARCREDLSILSGSGAATAVPQWFRDAVRREFPGSPGESHARSISVFLQDSFGTLARHIRTPFLAAGAVAASLLVIVFLSLRPVGDVPVIALSTVDWDRPASTLQPKTGMTLMGPAKAKTKAAIVLRFPSQKEATSQATVDAIYRHLNLRDTLKTHFDFLSPNQISLAVGEGTFTRLSAQDLSGLLHSKLGVSLVAVATLQKTPDGYTIDTELIEPLNHKVLYSKVSGPFPESEQTRHVKDSLLEGLTEYSHP